MSLAIWVPCLPPSSNQIYVRHPAGKGRILSDNARKFKIKAMRAIQDGGRMLMIKLKENVPYELKLAIFFERVEVKKSTVGARFVKMDLSNRTKLIEDTVASAVGLDDSHNFRLVLEKHCDPKNPGIYVHLRELPEEEVARTKEEYERQLPSAKPNRVDHSSVAGGNVRRTPRPRLCNSHRPLDGSS